MSDTEPNPDAADEAAEIEEFANEVRDTLVRMREDAEIAREVNPESSALDDVNLVHGLLVAYTGRIMALEAVARSVIATVRDESNWTAKRFDGTREKLVEEIEQCLKGIE